ncbi:MAG: PD-(D/E)XK nuclease family protein [Devosia sp.]|nr:PD-(D/E)XK nuclease family protein [Devosia sp.]
MHTALVQGRLAYTTRRAAAARQHEFGLQILTAPQLAARLAGGLKRPASRESIEAGIMAALARPENFRDLASVHHMPGMTRALVRTLRDVWRSGFDLKAPPYDQLPRVKDLAYVEDSVREALGPGECLPKELARLAREQVATAKLVVGPVALEGVHFVDPLWRPLINELRHQVDVSWTAPAGADTSWFEGAPVLAGEKTPEQWAFTAANPAHEALEAMRWARSLLASGAAKSHEIAIAATSTSAWDDQFLALSLTSELPISFLGGRPALATWEGQRCAALADALHNGLSQARVRRLLSLAAKQGTVLDSLPDLSVPVAGDASLSTAADWERALADHPTYAQVLVPILRELEKGPSAARSAAGLLLRKNARELWDEALRRAPASALMFTLDSLRVPDKRDPASAIAWCSAEQLAAAPRPFVWLLGLTTIDWPRNLKVDPILPDYLVPASVVDPDPVESADRRCFDIIRRSSTHLMLSSGRLNAQGTRASASPLLPPKPTKLYRDRIPKHALTESDRLMARPEDVANDAMASRAIAAWRDWSRRDLTAHDGMIGQPHALLSDLLTQPQSPTSLSLLLRDPLAYVWYYALGWRDLVHKERGLTLPADDYGRLVHELLKAAVDRLEPVPGYASAARHEIEDALTIAATDIIAEWPKHTNVPPPVLWTNTVRQAREMGLAALTFEPFSEADIRSWTEVPFGGERRIPISPIDLPWDHTRPVTLPGTNIRVQGVIDRVDLWPNAAEVHVNDYKTGQKPKKPDERYLGSGQELQRVLYDLACRTLLAGDPRRVARLVYLRPPVVAYPLHNADAVAQRLAEWVVLARHKLESGTVYPGVTSYEVDPRFGRLAMPASNAYRERKDIAIRQTAGPDLVRDWKQK